LRDAFDRIVQRVFLRKLRGYSRRNSQGGQRSARARGGQLVARKETSSGEHLRSA